MVTSTTATGLGAFDITIQRSNAWFDEFLDELGWKDKYKGYLALRITLLNLRDRLPLKKAAELGSVLPMLIRGLYYEMWSPPAGGKPVRPLNKTEYLNSIREYFDEPGVDPVKVVRAVFGMISKSMKEGEASVAADVLPEELREYWP